MSHAKEIKQKNDLQARFQIAAGQASSLVSSWLAPKPALQNETSTVENDPSKDAFFNLPIISEGSGLSLTSHADEADSINTIGDYVNSGKSLSSLKNKKQRQSRPNGIQARVTKTDSKALNALRNKMRNTQRGKQKETVTGQIMNKIKSQQIQQNNDSDDDDDDEPVQKSTKKTFTSFLDAKIKKK